MKTKAQVHSPYSYKRLLRRRSRCIRVRIYLNIPLTEHIRAKEVRAIRYHINASSGYCVCPNCNCTFEREYQNYCDRCGQKLAWKDFNEGKVIVIKRILPSFTKKNAPNDAHSHAGELASIL